MLERTFLYGLPLAGVGTPGVESLRGYTQRLAFAHNFKPRALVEMLQERYPREGGDFDISTVLKEWAVHCGGDVGESLRDRLERATGEDLKASTLAHISHVVARPHLAKTGRGRYCPGCVTEDDHHGRLLWEVACVNACPTHGVRLRSAAECGAEPDDRLKGNSRPRLSHVCSGCGSIGFKCIEDEPEAATPAEIWVAKQVGRLLACGAGTYQAWSTESLQRGMHQLVEGVYGGSVVEASLSAGLSRSSVCTWSSGKHRPSLAGLMQLCHHAQVDVVELLSGRLSNPPDYDDTAELAGVHSDNEEGTRTGEAPAVADRVVRAGLAVCPRGQARAPIDLMGRPYQVRECSLETLRQALQAAVSESPPPNLTELAGRLGTSRRFLREKWPAESTALATVAAQHRDGLWRGKFDESLEAYERAAKELLGREMPVTSKYLQQVSGLVAFSHNPSRVRAVAEVVRRHSPAEGP